MRAAKRLGILGFGVAVGVAAGIPAAVAADASTGSTAAAVSTASSGTSYNSVATATAGRVIIGDQQVPLPNIITAKTGDSPQSAELGSSDLENELSGVPTLGQDVIDSLNATTHGTGAYLIDAQAAASADGTSSACAGFLTGDCDVNGGSVPVQINLKASDLLTSAVVSTLPAATQTLVGTLGSALNSYYLVLTVSGPRATCTAGPEGSDGSNFTATQNLATVAVDIRNSSGDSILPVPVSVRSGDVLSALLGSQEKLPPQVSTLLNALESADPGLISTTIEPGDTEKTGIGPKAVGTAGELGLTVEGSRILDVKGAQAVCGPNTAAAATVTPPASPRPRPGAVAAPPPRAAPPAPRSRWAAVSRPTRAAGPAAATRRCGWAPSAEPPRSPPARAARCSGGAARRDCRTRGL